MMIGMVMPQQALALGAVLALGVMVTTKASRMLGAVLALRVMVATEASRMMALPSKVVMGAVGTLHLHLLQTHQGCTPLGQEHRCPTLPQLRAHIHLMGATPPWLTTRLMVYHTPDG